jgi:glutaredoxin
MREVSLVEVSSPGCHNCAAFKEMWEVESKNWPNVKFREVSLMDKEAAEIILKHQILASPGIIVNHELFSTGGVDKEGLIKKLTELSKE